jgi:spermidine synthase
VGGALPGACVADSIVGIDENVVDAAMKQIPSVSRSQAKHPRCEVING